MIDLTKNKIIVEKQDKLYFNLSIEEKDEKKHLLKLGSYVEFSISWTTEKYGNMHITIDLYKNPQIDNGIKLLSDINNDEQINVVDIVNLVNLTLVVLFLFYYYNVVLLQLLKPL